MMLKDQREASGVGEFPEAAAPRAAEAVPAGRSCSVAGCMGRYLARGYCIKHYYQVKRHGSVRPDGTRAPRPCRAPGCAEAAAARGCCLRHYRRQWRQALAAPRPRPAALRGEDRCREEDCPEAPFARGLCRLHYIVARSQDLLAV